MHSAPRTAEDIVEQYLAEAVTLESDAVGRAHQKTAVDHLKSAANEVGVTGGHMEETDRQRVLDMISGAVSILQKHIKSSGV